MRFPVAIALAVLLVGPGSAQRRQATKRHGSTKTTARVRGAGTDVTVRDGKLSVTLHMGEKCHAEKLAETIGKEVRQNPDAFGVGTGIRTEFWAVGDPTRSRSGKKGKSGKKGSRGGTSGLAGFELAFADVLATGRRGSGSGGGQTCFNGLNLNLGALVAANAMPVPEDAAFSNGPNGTKTASTQQGGVTTTWTKKAGQLTVSSSSTSGSFSSGGFGSGSQTTFTSKSTSGGSNLIGHELTHVVQQKSGNVSTTNADFKPDGSTKTEQTQSAKSGGVEVKVKNTETHDANGNKTGGKTEVEVNGKKAAEQEHDTGSKKAGGKGKAGGGGGPTLTPEGTFAMPPMCIPDEMVGVLINWNRLGAAVTNPSPIEDQEDAPDGKGGIGKVNKRGPCGSKDESSFDPDPAYLRPNKQGWVTDPVPFLRGQARSGRGGSRPSR